MADIDYKKNIERRQHLFDLYQDRNWMLQAGLGDIEFEQDMYDDIMYGEPFIDTIDTGQDVSDLLSSFPDDSYDKLAMAGLRKHTTMGPYRYVDHTPYDVGPFEVEGDIEPRYSANYFEYRKKPGDKRKLPPNWMDFNMTNILNMWNKGTFEGKKGNLQDQISDYTRHEYKHGIFDNENIYSHPAIFGSGARYNLDPSTTIESFNQFAQPERITTDYDQTNSPWNTIQYNPHRAGELAQEIVQKYAQPPRGAAGFNTGGIVSLML